MSGATAIIFGDASVLEPVGGFPGSDTQLTVTSPGGAAGTIDMRVATPYGLSNAIPADQYTYLGP